MAFNIFKEHSDTEHTNSTASYLLDGLLMKAKYKEDSNYRKLLDSFSQTFIQLEHQINAVGRETFPDETIALIERWERDLGIPDDIFDTNGTLEERRNNVLLKLASLGVQTEEDFVYIAGLIGYDNIVITTGFEVGVFPLNFPNQCFGDVKTTRFTVYIDVPKSLGIGFFPLEFPISFVSEQTNSLEKLFNLLKPANVIMIFRYVL